MRKIVQIAFAPYLNSENNSDNQVSSVDGDSVMYALCDDGTVWRWSHKWEKDEEYSNIPQD